MRELRFVTVDDGAGHLVVETHGYDAAGSEQFRLPVDDALRAALASPATVRPTSALDAPRRPLPTPGAQAQPLGPPEPATAIPSPSGTPAVSLREIQVRVRAGERPEDLAEEHNASLDWVMRFAGPVIQERSRVADEARRARARRSTSEAQTVIFGEAVDERFAAHGIDPATVLWDTHRREDGQWIVAARWVGGESERLAEWTFNLAARSVSPIDDTATDLLSDRPIRPVYTGGPVTLSVAPPLTPGVVAFPAMPNAHTGPLPTREQLFDQQVFERASSSGSSTSSAPAPSAVPATSSPPAAAPKFDAPPLPLGAVEQEPDDEPLAFEGDYDDELLDDLPYELAEDVAIDSTFESFDVLTGEEIVEEPTEQLPTIKNLGVAQRTNESDEERAARAHIPSWDDILLGVRRKND
jgi:hypothetical protein